jgi:hypothetical protein
VPVATPTYKHQCKPTLSGLNARFVWAASRHNRRIWRPLSPWLSSYSEISLRPFYAAGFSAASPSHHDIQFLSLSFKNRPYANLCYQAANWRGSQPYRPRYEKDIYSSFTRTISLKCIPNPETRAAVCRLGWRESANTSVSPGLYIPQIMQPFMLTLPTQDHRSACIIAVRTPEQATALNLCRVVRRGPNASSPRP